MYTDFHLNKGMLNKDIRFLTRPLIPHFPHFTKNNASSAIKPIIISTGSSSNDTKVYKDAENFALSNESIISHLPNPVIKLIKTIFSIQYKFPSEEISSSERKVSTPHQVVVIHECPFNVSPPFLPKIMRKNK